MDDNAGTQVPSENYWEKQELLYKKAYVTIALFAMNVLIFIACTFTGDLLYNKGALVTYRVIMEGELYRIFTAIFLHGGIDHIVNNMLMLVLVGAIIEDYTGHGLFIVLYLLSGVFGNLLSMAYEIRNSLNWVSVGASGAIMGLVGFLVVWLIANRKKMLGNKNLLFRLFLLAIFLVEACFFQEGANTVAHLGGFLTGFILGVINIVIFKNNKNMEGLV